MAEYTGRTVVVTGAGSGLGAAMADLFADAGANVALLDIDGLTAEEIARRSMRIAADICVYTNQNVVLEQLNSTR